ncbi:MAG: TolC family protein [Deltaproteobacteria bacterium]|nr:TolC family protein [Deltaproteobacteria bacterium]
MTPGALLSTVVAALILLVFPSPSVADGSKRVVTLAEAYRLAVENHEYVGMAEEGIVQADANYDKAFSQLLPKLNAEGSYTAYSKEVKSGTFTIQPDDSSRIDVKLTQPLYSGGREWAARRQAASTLDKMRLGFNAAREAVMRAVARAYFGALKALKDVEIKKAALKRADERRKVATARLKVGELTKSAALRAEAVAAGAEADLIKADGEAVNARNLLKRVVGITEDFDPVEPPLKPLPIHSHEDAIKAAYADRLDYRQSILEKDALEAGVDYAESGYYPSLRLEGAYSWKEQEPHTTFFQKESVYGAAVLTFPIFEGGLRIAEVSEARSKAREADFKRLALKRDIALQITEAVNRMNTAKAVIESYKRQNAFAEEDYKMVFEQFKYGLATTVDIIDADATLISAQSSLMNSTYDYELSKLEYKVVIGSLLEELEK